MLCEGLPSAGPNLYPRAFRGLRRERTGDDLDMKSQGEMGVKYDT